MGPDDLCQSLAVEAHARARIHALQQLVVAAHDGLVLRSCTGHALGEDAVAVLNTKMVWYGMVWYGMVWYGMVWYGMVWYGMVWYGMVWYGMVWYGMVWYGMLLLLL